MTDIKWQSPPGKGYDKTKWVDLAEALRARPCEWALIEEGAGSASIATAIRTGRYAAFRPAGEFEARSLTLKNGGGFDIYARFVGEVTA